jgi:hypothetical protein
MAAIPRLQTLSAADLDGLLAELKQQGSTELILVGPDAWLTTNPEHWLDDLGQGSVVYHLKEAVPELAQRLASLTQLTSLNLGATRLVMKERPPWQPLPSSPPSI